MTFRKITIEKNKNNNQRKLYLTRSSDCKGCPYKTQCAGKSPEKRITITIYKKEYERAIEQVNSPMGRFMKTKRQSTGEPVFGTLTLTQFLAMRKVNTRGIRQANKVMMMAAMAYNLKKYLNFNKSKCVTLINTAGINLNSTPNSICSFFGQFWGRISFYADLNYSK